MARKKTRKPARPPRRKGPRIVVPASVRRGVIVVTIVALSLVLLSLGLDRVRALVDADPDYQVRPELVTVREVPAWLSPEELASLRRDSALPGPIGFYDPTLVRRVRDAWGRSPMVAAVPEVLRLHPDRVVVEILVRRPVAAVEDFGSPDLPLVLVDRDAVVWPGRFRAPLPERFGARIPVIRCDVAKLTATPAPGRAWRDERVLQGLAVALDLRQRVDDDLAAEVGVVAIDVTNVGAARPGEPEVRLETASGASIEWGRSSRSPLAGREVPLATKIAHLRQVVREPGLAHTLVVRVQFDRLHCEPRAE